MKKFMVFIILALLLLTIAYFLISRPWKGAGRDEWVFPEEQEVPFIKNITGTDEAENILKEDSSKKVGKAASTEEQKSAPPVIKNLGVAFAAFNPSTKKAGSFLFTVKPWNNKILGEFGQEVKDAGGDIKPLPHYSYFVPENTPVTAVSDGEIVAIFYQEQTKDYEIHVKPTYDSYWDINYDHVINLLVKEKDQIKAGDIIASAGDFNFAAPLEISLISEKEKPATFYPLFSYFDASLKEEYEQKVWQLMSDWETYKNNKNIYDEAAMNPCPACLEVLLSNNYE